MIRPATPGDADAIWDIFQKVVAGRDTYVFLPGTRRDEAVAYWLAANAIARVAESDGRVVGMYKLIENHRGSATRWAPIAFAKPAARATRRCSSISS
jgi:predicted N-acetyltransferase YhbS